MLYPSTNLRPQGTPLLYKTPEQANQFMRYWLGLEIYHYNKVITQYASLFAIYNAVLINQPYQVLTQSQYYYDWFFNQWYGFDLELCINIRVNSEYQPCQGMAYRGINDDGVQILLNKKFKGASLIRVNFENSDAKFREFLFMNHVCRLRTTTIEVFDNIFNECQKEFEPEQVGSFDKNPFSDMLPYYIFW